VGSDEVILELWGAGMTMTAIGDHLGVTRERVRQRLQRHGISGPDPKNVPPAATILSVMFSCTSTTELAREIGVSERKLLLGIAEELVSKIL
jgi:hypothetical protein